MKKMSTKRVFPAVTMAVGLALIAGCGGGGGEESGNGGGEEEAGGNDASGEGGLDGGDDGEANNEGEEGDTHINLATASETGLYYPLGATLANFWSNEVDGVASSSQASNGSVQNMIYMAQGEADAGFVMGNILQDAYEGENGFEGEQYEDVRILAGIYPNYNHVVMREGAGIESIGDIEGESFAPGATGSGTEIASQHILGAYDLTFDDINANFGDFPEATDLMRNNQVAGANINGGLPTSAVSEMLSTANGELMSIDDEQRQEMLDEYDFYIDETIPAGTYEGQEEDVHTTAMQNFLVVDASMSDEVAYDITKAMWDNIEDLHSSHETFQQFEVENFEEGSGDIPFHPGAEQYYEEEGLLE